MSKNSKLNIFLRMYLVPAVLPSLMKMQPLRKEFFELISQTEINYVHSSLSKGNTGKIKAGMRFPYIKLSINSIHNISVFHLIRDNANKPFLLLVYNIDASSSQQNSLLNIIQIENNNYNDKLLHKAGFSNSFICLLRPDNYIGYIAETFNQTEINQYLHSFIN